jgi:hypothetical protein
MAQLVLVPDFKNSQSVGLSIPIGILCRVELMEFTKSVSGLNRPLTYGQIRPRYEIDLVHHTHPHQATGVRPSFLSTSGPRKR